MGRPVIRRVWAFAAALALLLLPLAHLTGCWSDDLSGSTAGSRVVAVIRPALMVSEHAGVSVGRVRSDDDCCRHHRLLLIAVNRTIMDPAPPDRAVAVGHVPSGARHRAASRPDDGVPIRARPLHVLHCVSRC